MGHGAVFTAFCPALMLQCIVENGQKQGQNFLQIGLITAPLQWPTMVATARIYALKHYFPIPCSSLIH
jgi:hypothetical protein